MQMLLECYSQYVNITVGGSFSNWGTYYFEFQALITRESAVQIQHM